MEELLLRAQIPSVISFRRPLRRQVADYLSSVFYFHLFEKRRTFAEALFEARKTIYDDYSDTEANYFAWISPILVWQEQKEAILIKEMIEAYFGSFADPKEPAKVVLKEAMREFFPKKTIDEVYLGSLFQALKEDPGTCDFNITHDDLTQVLKYEVPPDIDLHKLNQDQFFEQMSAALKENLPFDDTKDPSQIIRNLLTRTHGIMVSTLSLDQNQEIWRSLMSRAAEQQGQELKVIYGEVQQILPGFHLAFMEVVKKLDEIGWSISGLKEDTAKSLELMNNLSKKPLDGTEEGRQLINYFGRDAVNGRVSPGSMNLAGLLHMVDGYKELAYTKYLNALSSPEERNRHFECFWNAVIRYARLKSGNYASSDLNIDDIADCGVRLL